MSNDAYNLPGKQRLVALINRDNNSALNMDMFRFGAPSVSFTNRNTRVTFQTRAGLFFVGYRHFFYNRLDLGTFFNTAFDVDEILLSGSYETTLDIANALNAIYGTAIEENDIVLEPVYGEYHLLKSVSTSYAWVGQVVIRMIDASESHISMIIQLQVLDGLTFPSI